jgi:hypothetical protein
MYNNKRYNLKKCAKIEKKKKKKMKITKKNPIFNIMNDFLIDSPLPLNISYFWNFGSLLGLN